MLLSAPLSVEYPYTTLFRSFQIAEILRTLHRLDVHLNFQCLRFVFTIYRQEKFPIGGTMGEFVVGTVPMEFQPLRQIARASGIEPVEFLRSKSIDYVHPQNKKSHISAANFCSPSWARTNPDSYRGSD